MSAQIDVPKYTYLKRGVYYFVFLCIFLTGCQSAPQKPEPSAPKILVPGDIRSMSTRHTLSPPRKYSYKVVNDIARMGTESERIEARDNDCSSIAEWSDCKKGQIRQEREEIKDRQFAYDQIYWIGYSIFLTSDWADIYPSKMYAGQIKPIGGESVNYDFGARPIVALELSQRPGVRFVQTWGYCNLNVDISTWTDKWTDILFKMDTSVSDIDGDGVFFEVWINGEKKCIQRQPIALKAFRSSRGMGFRYGIYQINAQEYRDFHTIANGGKKAKVPTRAIYYDEMLIGSTRESVDVRLREQNKMSPVN